MANGDGSDQVEHVPMAERWKMDAGKQIFQLVDEDEEDTKDAE